MSPPISVLESAKMALDFGKPRLWYSEEEERQRIKALEELHEAALEARTL